MHDSLDSLERVKADLATLPPLRAKYVAAYLHSEDPDAPGTLGIVREMRRVRWSEDVARTMMYRWPARGTGWLLEQKDPDAAFDRCWELAAVPLSKLQKPKQRRRPYVSHASDQAKVLAYVEAHPGLGTRALRESRCGLEGISTNERIQAALKVLVADGRICRVRGPHKALFHFVVEGKGTDSGPTTTRSLTPSEIGGKRYGTYTPKRARRRAKVWKQYQGLTIIRWRAWVLLRRVADLSLPVPFGALRDQGIVKPTVLWKYLRALEESGLLCLAEEDLTGWGERMCWVVRAAAPEAVEVALSAENLRDEDRPLWETLRASYERREAASRVPTMTLDDLLSARESE